MVHYLSEAIPEPFLRPELLDRVAGMLNGNIKQLCGPKCSSLKVQNMQSYSFDPKLLLDRLSDIYLHLDCDACITAVASDDRSYTHELFLIALKRINKSCIKSPLKTTKLEQFINKVLFTMYIYYYSGVARNFPQGGIFCFS